MYKILHIGSVGAGPVWKASAKVNLEALVVHVISWFGFLIAVD